MTRFGDWVTRDPLDETSRFTRAPAVALMPTEELAADVYQRHGADSEEARAEAIERMVGRWALDEQEDLGAPRLRDASYGIGAEMWAVVVSWAAEGIVAGTAWVATVAAARRFRTFVNRLRAAPETASVSAGGARLIAIAAVLDEANHDPGPLDTEAIEHPSTLGGAEPITLGYVDEPWIVLLASPRAGVRYVVALTAEGHVSGIVTVPLSPRERALGVHVEIPGEADATT